MIDETLGPYRVLDKLGQGGMGEVYRARDTRLGRDVAIKVLPVTFANDPERLARFEREAHVLASLNHPHIAQIYGLELEGTTRALVMELVEGPTLAELIARGSLDLAEALRIARQIAIAVETAHNRGVTHRDLKPSNIKLSPDGSVKVLDFGLAKFQGPFETGRSSIDRSVPLLADLTASPTLTSPVLATGVGIILGTAAYMSPEQAKGKPVDKRADIWAFGCVLYEMLTGRRPFEGEDVSDTLAAVIRGQPDWTLLPSDLSPALAIHLRRCFEKLPEQRVQDMGDMRLALEGAFDIPGAPTPRAAQSWTGWTRTIAIAASAAIVAAVAGGVGGWLLSPAKPSPIVRLVASPPRTASITPSQNDADVAVSPDGSRIAFVNIEQGSLRLYVRSLDQLDSVRLEVGGSPRFPFFSPDGAWVGFFDNGVLKRVSVNGGSAIPVTTIKGIGMGATWSSDGTIVFATTDSTGLLRVSLNGGEVAVITNPKPGEDHILPQFLPDGTTVLFTVRPQGNPGSGSQIALLDLNSGAVSMLLPGATYARYAPSGHLVYAADGALRAVAFDLDTRSVGSNAGVPVVDRVITKPLGAGNFAIASNGTLVYEAGDPTTSADRTLVWVTRDGREEAIQAPKRSYVYPRISPDGKRVGLDIRDQQNDIWIWDFTRQTLSRLTFDPGLNRAIVWTPDSRRVVFSAERGGRESLFLQAADGSGSPEQLTTTTPDRPQGPLSFSPDGKWLVFGEPGQPPFDLNLLGLGQDRKVTQLLNTAYSEHNGEISPDGRWLVYQSDESGTNEIYIRPFPNVTVSRSQISSGGGTRPAWSRDGREIFYSGLDGAMMAVSVDSTATRDILSIATPKTLFSGPYYSVQAGRSYDVATDGRFLMIKNNAPQAAAPQLVVVLNWTDDLKRLVP